MKSPRRAPLIALVIWISATLFWWGLAFYPTGHASPEWLISAREVCFGTLENGLPAPSGWMLLVLAPLLFLVALLAIWSRELKEDWPPFRNTDAGRILLAAVLIMAVLEATWAANRVRDGLRISQLEFSPSHHNPLPQDYPRTDKPAPDFTLTDQNARPIQLSSLRGETLLLTFAFAHCQTVCPVLVKESLESLKGPNSQKLRVLIVTLDPWRDTPKSLPFLAEKWGLPANAHVLSGKVKDVLQVLEEYQVPYQRDQKTGEVTHPALTYLISSGGRITYTFNNAPSAWLGEAVRRTKNEEPLTAAR